MRKQHEQNRDFLLFVCLFFSFGMGWWADRSCAQTSALSVTFVPCEWGLKWLDICHIMMQYRKQFHTFWEHEVSTRFSLQWQPLISHDYQVFVGICCNRIHGSRQQSDPKRRRLSTKLHAGTSQMSTTVSSLQSRHWTLPWTKWSPHPHTLFLRH